MAIIYTLVNKALAVASPSGEDVLPDSNKINTGSKFQDVPSIIRTVFNFVIGIAGAIFVILLLVGGIQYLTGAGNEETTNKAKKLMIDAIIGLIIVLAAWAIGTYILNAFGYNL